MANTQKLEELKQLKAAQKKLLEETETAKTYRINGKEYSQNFLTIDKIIRLGKMLRGIDFTQIGDYMQALELLQDSGKMQEFFEIILEGPKTDFTKAPAHILMRAVVDFFSLNQLFELMGELASATAIQQAAEGLLIGKTPSPHSQTETSPNTGQSAEK